MNKKSLSVLFAASLLALCAGACGTDSAAPSGQETPDTSSAGNTDTPSTEEAEKSTEKAEETDTDVILDETAESNESPSVSSPVTVTFKENNNEIKADDGTVLLETSTSMPVVSIEGADEIAAKINADIETLYTTFGSSDDETLELAKSDYETSQADEDGGWFHGYSQYLSANVTRADDKVLSLEFSTYVDTGGAHGNSGAIGKNYDLRTGELISLDDLAEDFEAFHATALDYVVNQAESPSYKDRLFEPSKNDLDSALFEWGSWVFTQSGISFMSDPYVLGPYASGEIYFRLPYEKAYELGLKKDYHYDGNFVDERYYINKYDTETMEPIVDDTPDFSFDLNGDGTEEVLAFYGMTYVPDDGSSKYTYYIDGTDWGAVVREQIGDAAANGYLHTSYALYDSDPSDGLTEIAVMFTEFNDDASGEDSTERSRYTYLFRYTEDKELQFLERRDGFVTDPLSSH